MEPAGVGGTAPDSAATAAAGNGSFRGRALCMSAGTPLATEARCAPQSPASVSTVPDAFAASLRTLAPVDESVPRRSIPASHSTAKLLEGCNDTSTSSPPLVIHQTVYDMESTATQTSPRTRIYSRHLLPNWMTAPHFDYRRIMDMYFHGFHLYHPNWLPRGSHVAAVANISASTWGIGSLTMPYAAAHCGLVWFVVGMGFVYCFMLATQYLTCTLVDVTQMHSYELIARSVFKTRRYEVMVEVFLVFNCFGWAVAYHAIVGDVVSTIVSGYVPEPSVSLGVIRVLAMLAGYLVVMLPLSLMRTLGALKYVSALGVVVMVVLSVFVVSQGLTHADTRNLQQTATPGFLSFASGTSLLLVGFNNQFNAIEIYSELKERTPRQFCGMLAVATGIIGAVYLLVGISGLAQYGPQVAGNIIRSIDVTSSPFAFVAMVGILAKVVLSYPMLVFPLREAVLHFLAVDDVRAASPRQFQASTFFVTAAAFLVAVFVPTIVTLLSLVGSICVGMFAFILPAVLIWNTPSYWVSTKPRERQAATALVACAVAWGGFVSVAGTVAAVITFVSGS